MATSPDRGIGFTRNPCARDCDVGIQAETPAGEVVDDAENAKAGPSINVTDAKSSLQCRLPHWGSVLVHACRAHVCANPSFFDRALVLVEPVEFFQSTWMSSRAIVRYGTVWSEPTTSLARL